MTSVADLYALQEIDLALQAARTEIDSIDSRLDESEELVEARALAEERQSALRAAEKAFKEREFEADELKRKIEPLERKLYQGTITSPKELEDLQQDIDSLKRRRGELEDRALGAMDALEETQRAFADAERSLAGLTQAGLAEHEELRARRDELEREIEGLEEQRREHAALVEPGLLGLYDRLVTTRGGRAVAKLEGGACGGCRISLPMNLIHRARAGNELVQCTNCERVLYVT